MFRDVQTSLLLAYLPHPNAGRRTDRPPKHRATDRPSDQRPDRLPVGQTTTTRNILQYNVEYSVVRTNPINGYSQC